MKNDTNQYENGLEQFPLVSGVVETLSTTLLMRQMFLPLAFQKNGLAFAATTDHALKYIGVLSLTSHLTPSLHLL